MNELMLFLGLFGPFLLLAMFMAYVVIFKKRSDEDNQDEDETNQVCSCGRR